MGELTMKEIENIVATAPTNIDEGCGCETCAHALTASALRQLLNAQKWRPIEIWPEGLEDIYIAHLVWCPEIRCKFTVTRRDGEFKSFGGSGNISHRVSHYRPLPPSPEEENGDA